MSTLEVVPVSFADACAFIADWHRHHAPPVGHKFSLGVAAGTVLVGVAVIGRPVARHFDNGVTLEVIRTATDGTAHVNSMLYGAAWRAAKALGYRRLVTYTQAGESGSSLRAAGWQVVGERRGSGGLERAESPPAVSGDRPCSAFPVGGVMTDDHRCEAVVDDDGTVLGRARVSPDLGERGRRALVEVVKAAIRLQAERDAADPVGAAERGRRQEAAIARVRAGARRSRGETE